MYVFLYRDFDLDVIIRLKRHPCCQILNKAEKNVEKNENLGWLGPLFPVKSLFSW